MAPASDEPGTRGPASPGAPLLWPPARVLLGAAGGRPYRCAPWSGALCQ